MKNSNIKRSASIMIALISAGASHACAPFGRGHTPLLRMFGYKFYRQVSMIFSRITLALACLTPFASWAQQPTPLPPVENILAENSRPHRLSSIEFRGNVAIGADELNASVKTWLGQEVSSKEIEALRQQISKFYVNHGYLFAVVRIAASPDADGVMAVEISEGRVAEMRIRGTEDLSPDYVSARLADSANSLNVNTLIDRYRLLLSDPLFKNINSRLLPGAEPGLALLDIEVVRATPYHLDVFANNHHPPAIGADTLGVSGWLRNLTGHGDVLEFWADHSQGSTPLNLSWSTPIAASTTLFNLSYSEGRSSVIEEPMRTIDIKSMARGYEVGVVRPLVESLSRRVSLGLAYAEHESRTTLAGIPFSFTPGEVDGQSKSRTVRFSQDWSEVGASSVFSLHSVFNFGRNNNQGRVAEAPDSKCIYWNGQASWLRNILDDGTQLVLRGNMQITHNRLLPTNRASVGGVNTVRGYRENQLVRDESAVGSVELHYPILSGGKAEHNLQLVPFFDAGIAANQGGASESLRSVGMGAIWRYVGWHADVYWASRLKSVPAPTNPTAQDRGIHFQIGYNFF